MRRMLVAGNWKMNGSHAALDELDAIAPSAVARPVVDAAICPPFTLIERAVARAGALRIGAQDCHAEEKGAHTGCVSPANTTEEGQRPGIVGHNTPRRTTNEP